MLQGSKSEWLWESHSEAASLQLRFKAEYSFAIGERGVGQAGVLQPEENI